MSGQWYQSNRPFSLSDRLLFCGLLHPKKTFPVDTNALWFYTARGAKNMMLIAKACLLNSPKKYPKYSATGTVN
jgi:hypothetical protein